MVDSDRALDSEVASVMIKAAGRSRFHEDPFPTLLWGCSTLTDEGLVDDTSVATQAGAEEQEASHEA